MADDPVDFFSALNAPTPAAAPAPVGENGQPLQRVPIYKSKPELQFFNDLEAPKPPDARQYGYGETAARHLVHGATLGFSDELTGVQKASPVPQWAANAIPGGIPAQMMSGLARMGYEKLGSHLGFEPGHEATDAYTKARDEERKALEESATQHPVVSTGADIAGSLALPGGSALKGATWGARALRGALVSGAQGAARGAGDAPEIGDVPASAGTGAVIGATLGAPVNAAFGPRGASIANQALIDTANKYGVQLPAYMVSESPFVQSMGRWLDHLPFVGGALSRAGAKAKEGVQNIRDEMVEKATGIPGATPSEVRTMASNSAKNAVEGFAADSKKVAEQNYNAVTGAMANPSARAIPNNMIHEIANQSAKLQNSGGEPGSVLSRAVDAINVRGGLNYQGLKDLRTELYRKWKSMQGKSDTEYADYVGLIGSITKDMEHLVQTQGGPRAVALWNSANTQFGAGRDIAKTLGQAIGKGEKDTSAADAILGNITATKPNIGAVNTLRNTMKPTEWDKVQASVIGRMGGDEAGGFSMAKFITADQKMTEAGKRAMFGASGPKREAYNAVLDLGKAIQAVDKFKNTSGTAPLLAGLGLAGQLYHDYRSGDYTNTAGEVGLGMIAAAILARPATARAASAYSKAINEYITKPTAWAAGKIPRAVETAARNFAIQLSNSEGSVHKYADVFVPPTPLGSQ